MNIFTKSWFKIASSLGIGAFFLYLVLKNTNATEVQQILAHANLEWCFGALLCYGLAIGLRSLRWQKLLNHLNHLDYPQVLKSLIVGYSINNILPARLGEIFRADYVKRNYQLNRTEVLGSIAIERLLDGLIVIGALCIGILGVEAKSIHGSIIIPLCITSAIVFGMTALVFIIFGGERQFTIFKKHPFLQAKICQFAQAIGVLRHRSIVPILILSIIIWTFEILSIACIMNFAGIHLTVLPMLVAIGVISLATLLPSPPGYLGTLQYAYVLVVAPFGFDAAQGLVAATASQIFLMGSLTLTGLGILGFDLFNRYRVKYFYPASRVQ